MSAADHACAACGGTVSPHVYGKGTRLSSAYAQGVDGKPLASYIQRARRDAECDAETLRSFRLADMRNSTEEGRTEANLGVAEWYGVNARYFIKLARVKPNRLYHSNEGQTVAELSFVAFAQAQKAARAAFRAVPGLRGE